MEQKEKLMKLLELSGSDNDNEALSAIRKANQILKSNKLRWDQIFKGTQVKYVYLETEPQGAEDRDLGEKLNFLMEELGSFPDSAAEFITSLYTQYEKNKRLSEKQANAVDKFYNNTAFKKSYY